MKNAGDYNDKNSHKVAFGVSISLYELLHIIFVCRIKGFADMYITLRVHSELHSYIFVMYV